LLCLLLWFVRLRGLGALHLAGLPSSPDLTTV
jgi:hypothetical protein